MKEPFNIQSVLNFAAVQAPLPPVQQLPELTGKLKPLPRAYCVQCGGKGGISRYKSDGTSKSYQCAACEGRGYYL